jgi:hypothetical protein
MLTTGGRNETTLVERTFSRQDEISDIYVLKVRPVQIGIPVWDNARLVGSQQHHRK